MLFSVVIPTYNRAETLARTLQALARQDLAQDEKPLYEVIVVDDGSSDHTQQVCRGLAEGYPTSLAYLHQENKKQGAARNLGARRATGEYLVFLGDDTVPKTDFLTRHLEDRDSSDRRVVVIGYTPWARGYPVTRFMEHIGEKGWQFGFSLIEDPENVPFNFFYSSNISLSRTFFLDAGGFDEEFQEYGWEDIELSLRLKAKGMRLTYHPRAIAYHHHPTTLKSFLRRQHKVGYSAWTFRRKHPEMADFLNTDQVAPYPLSRQLKMAALTRICSWTERLDWPDLSRYYPDLLSYHYNLGLLRARDE